MSSSRVLFHVCTAALLAACGGSDSFEPVELPATRVQANWRTTELQQTYEVRSDADWKATWEAHEPQTTPRSQRPQIDFSQYMIIGLTFGTGPNGCYGIGIRRVIEEAERIRVEYYRVAERPSVPDQLPPFLCSQAIVPLTDFAVVRTTDKPAVFLQIAV